jgi:hypothetical protein
MLKGAIHTHSTYSDGDLTLAELREVYRAAGCAFVCLTDHAEVFNTDKARAYVAECASLSTPDFQLIPGLEFAGERRLHVLGLGVTELGVGRNPVEIFEHIARAGGVSIVAHPHPDHFAWLETLSALPQGIEVWNSKYDGRYAPRVATFDLLATLKRRRPDMRAFYGQDYHWRRQYRGLFVESAARQPLRTDVLAAFAAGDFAGVKERYRLPSSGRLTDAERVRFSEVHERSERIRGLVKQARTLAVRWGMPVPPGLKAQLRRIF